MPNTDDESPEALNKALDRVSGVTDGLAAVLTDNADEERERSLEQAKLFTALIKFQGTIRTVEADSENPHFNQKYASLAALWTAIKDPLANAELCLIQEPEPNEHGVMLRTTLAHSSGEWRSSRLFIPISEKQSKNPQAFGSALAYAKRYAAGAILGVATTAEDDDGSGAAELRLSGPTPEDKAYKGWMAWADSQIDLMEKAKSQKQLDRILLETNRRMEGQPIPDAMRARLNAAFDKATTALLDEDIPQ